MALKSTRKQAKNKLTNVKAVEAIKPPPVKDGSALFVRPSQKSIDAQRSETEKTIIISEKIVRDLEVAVCSAELAFFAQPTLDNKEVLNNSIYKVTQEYQIFPITKYTNLGRTPPFVPSERIKLIEEMREYLNLSHSKIEEMREYLNLSHSNPPFYNYARFIRGKSVGALQSVVSPFVVPSYVGERGLSRFVLLASAIVQSQKLFAEQILTGNTILEKINAEIVSRDIFGYDANTGTFKCSPLTQNIAKYICDKLSFRDYWILEKGIPTDTEIERIADNVGLTRVFNQRQQYTQQPQ